jgi:hypothetical protein
MAGIAHGMENKRNIGNLQSFDGKYGGKITLAKPKR